MLTEILPYGKLNRIGGDDIITLREETSTGSTVREVALTELKDILNTVPSQTGIKTLIYEGRVSFAGLADNVIEFFESSQLLYFRSLQVRVVTAVEVSDGSSITNVGFFIGDTDEVASLSFALTAGTQISFPAALAVGPNTEFSFGGVDGGDELGTGELEAGEIDVRLVFEYHVPLTENPLG